MNIELDGLRARRVLCAVSGGADSMCLLCVLAENGIDVCAAHFEHGIRGEEAERDADFVRAFCAKRQIPCVVGHARTPEYARAKGMSLEQAARELRYGFLQNAARELSCELIATAHNAGDNTETVLFNLARGAGGAGLRGIPEARGNIVRPLLHLQRIEIERYLDERGIPHVEDSTNAGDEYSRNLIRHRVMPVLREINPALDEAVGRTARLMRQDDDCLSELAERFLAESFDGESVPLDRLNALHGAVASRVIRRLFNRSLSLEHVEKLLELCRRTERSLCDLPGQRVRIERGRLWLQEEEKILLPERRLVIGQALPLPEAGLIIQSRPAFFSEEINGLFKTYYLKCENINGDIVVSGRRPGDSYRPLGRGCTKSLKSLFAEKGMTQAERDRCPVLRDETGILAVYGFAPDERMALSPGERAAAIIFEKM